MPQKHTKDTLATEVAHKVRALCPKCGRTLNVTQQMVLDIVNTYLTELALALRDDNALQMRGLGTFRLADKRTTKWDPQRKESVPVPPAKTVRFKVAQAFVDIATGEDDPYAAVNPDLAVVAPHPDVAANFNAQTEGE